MAKAPKGTPFRSHYFNGELVIYPAVEKWLKEDMLPRYNLSWEDWMRYVDVHKQSGRPQQFKSFNVNPHGLGVNQLQKLKDKVETHVYFAHFNKVQAKKREDQGKLPS